MDSRHLGYFSQIVDCGSMSAAARTLGIAQPSLSQHVKNLEAHLGAELLLRTSKGVMPTEAGEVLYRHAKRVAETLHMAEEEVRAAAGTPAGRVVFGLPASVSMALSVPLAETTRLELPLVQLCAVEAMSGYIKNWVVNGDVDIGLLYDLDGLTNFRARELVGEEIYFVSAADDWPFESKPGSPVPLRDLAGLEMVLPSMNHGLRTLAERAAKSIGISYNIVIEMDSLQQIKALVARGSGHTLLSPAAIDDMAQSNTLLKGRVIDPVIRRPVFLVRNADKSVTIASRAVERLCEDVIKDLVKRGIWQAEVLPKPNEKAMELASAPY